MKIIKFLPRHIESVIELSREFDAYLWTLSTSPRIDFSTSKMRSIFENEVFGKKKILSGYIAKIDGEIVGYVLYHSGFDPDEMQWKIIYIVDLFVSEKARRQWVWKSLIEKLQSHPDSLGLYFGVWKKNTWAIDFYKNIGADWIEDVPFMKLMN